MAWTKRQIIEEAFGELALAGYDYDLAPEEIQAALRRLDTMIAGWATSGIALGYHLGLSPDGSDPDEDSGIPLHAVEAVYMNLAVRIAAGKGKALMPSTKTAAKHAYDNLLLRVVRDGMATQQLPGGIPLGAGHKPRYGEPFTTNHDTGPIDSMSGGLSFNT